MRTIASNVGRANAYPAASQFSRNAIVAAPARAQIVSMYIAAYCSLTVRCRRTCIAPPGKYLVSLL